MEDNRMCVIVCVLICATILSIASLMFVYYVRKLDAVYRPVIHMERL